MSKPAEFLCQKYTGLFYIGRSGNQLTAEEVDTVASTMLHLHSMADTPDQALLIEWYTTVDETITGENLIERLKKCPEVTALGFDVRYIAYALHQSVPGLDFGPLDDELIKRLQ